MRILDVYDNEIENPDLALGYLQEDRVFVQRHGAVEPVAEQGHWETIAEYPNGGRDVEWVVDVPGVEAAEAWDEYEDVLRYVRYTAEELAERARPTLMQRLEALEQIVQGLLMGMEE